MFSLYPYVLIAGGLAIAGLGGVSFYQDHQIHYYHQAFNKEHDAFTLEHNLVVRMTDNQNRQTKTTEGVVTKVVQGPGTVKTKTIIKEIHDTPVVGCKTPEFPQDVKDAY
jgi:hypothetical protein